MPVAERAERLGDILPDTVIFAMRRTSRTAGVCGRDGKGTALAREHHHHDQPEWENNEDLQAIKTVSLRFCRMPTEIERSLAIHALVDKLTLLSWSWILIEVSLYRRGGTVPM